MLALGITAVSGNYQTILVRSPDVMSRGARGVWTTTSTYVCPGECMSARMNPLQQLHWIPTPQTLRDGFSRQAAGSWIAVSPDRKRVVGRGATAAKAEHDARLSGHVAAFLVRMPDNHASTRGAHDTPRNGQANGNGDGHLNSLSLPSLYRGIYKRVAHKLHCDPSYVSRVARGERTSPKVSAVLQSEIDRTLNLSH